MLISFLAERAPGELAREWAMPLLQRRSGLRGGHHLGDDPLGQAQAHDREGHPGHASVIETGTRPPSWPEEETKTISNSQKLVDRQPLLSI